MDNRGNNRDSDRDSDRDRDRQGSGSRRNGNDRDRDDRDQRRDPSSASNSQPRRIEEEDETTSYRSQIAPRSTNITTNRVAPAATSNTVMERFYSYGFGPGIPMKPGGKSAAVVAIQ